MKITYEKIVVTVPDTVLELGLNRYRQIVEIAKHLKDDGSAQSILASFKIVEIVCDLTENELDQLSIDEMKDLSAMVSLKIKSYK